MTLCGISAGGLNVDFMQILTEPEFMSASSRVGSEEPPQAAAPQAAVPEDKEAVLEAMRQTLANADNVAKATQKYAAGLKNTFKLLEASLGRRQTQAAAVATQPAVAEGGLGASALGLIKRCWQIGEEYIEKFDT